MKINLIPKRQGGSSILLVLWAMIMMTMAVASLIHFTSWTVDEEIEASKTFKARLLAMSAMELARHPKVNKGDPLLSQKVATHSRYDVWWTTEGKRFAINRMAESAGIRTSFQALLHHWGMDAEKAAVIGESIADWLDADDLARVHGAESDYYLGKGHQNYPHNRGFRNLDEVLLVRGMDELDRLRPNWRDYLTLWGDGKFDVNEMEAEVLEFVCETTPDAAFRLVSERWGPDGRPRTEDDIRITSLRQVQQLLGMDNRDFGRIEDRLTLAHPIRRIEARGFVGNREKLITLVEGQGVRIYREH